MEVGNALFMVTFSAYVMLSLDKRMTLISLAVVPVIFTFAVVFFRKVRTAFQTADEAEAEMTTVLQENLTGVGSCVRLPTKPLRLRNLKRKLRPPSQGFPPHLAPRATGVHQIFSHWQIAIVAAAGAYLTAQGSLSIGTMVVYSSYVGMLLWPVRQMGRILTDMGKALVAAERIQEILDAPREVLEENFNKPEIKGGIVFDNVYFGYEPDKPVLKGISFTVEPGQTVGI